LKGSWTAKPEGAGFWKSDWVEKIEPHEVPELVAVARAWDTAHSIKSEVNPNPDYTAGTKLGKDRFGTYYILHAVHFRKRAGEMLNTLAEIALDDGVMDCTQVVQKDSGAGGQFFRYMATTLAEMGVAIKPDQISGHAGKVARFKPFASLCENGNVKMVKGDWNEEFIFEMENFTGERSRIHDDKGCRL
jgi:predicted phage terminase large subunit-like protein